MIYKQIQNLSSQASGGSHHQHKRTAPLFQESLLALGLELERAPFSSSSFFACLTIGLSVFAHLSVLPYCDAAVYFIRPNVYFLWQILISNAPFLNEIILHAVKQSSQIWKR